jgi:hypothetical protein
MADRTEDTSAAFSLLLLFADFAKAADNPMNALAHLGQVFRKLTAAVAALTNAKLMNSAETFWANCAHG